jgi:hypothetical protein
MPNKENGPRITIGGNVQGANIVIGNNNTVVNTVVNLASSFDEIHARLDADKNIPPEIKTDVKAELVKIKTALEETQPDEGFLAARFRNLKRMAPDITAVALETLKNPVSGVVEIIKRVSKKIAEDAG